MNAPNLEAQKTSRRFEPSVSNIDLSHAEGLKPSSYDMYMGLRTPQPPENLWLDVQI